MQKKQYSLARFFGEKDIHAPFKYVNECVHFKQYYRHTLPCVLYIGIKTYRHINITLWLLRKPTEEVGYSVYTL